MIKQIAKEFIKNIINGNLILNVFAVIVGPAIGGIFMYFRLHYSIYDILIGISIGIIITAFIFLLSILIHTILQLVFKSEKNN